MEDPVFCRECGVLIHPPYEFSWMVRLRKGVNVVVGWCEEHELGMVGPGQVLKVMIERGVDLSPQDR